MAKNVIINQGTSLSVTIGVMLVILKIAGLLTWGWPLILLPFYWELLLITIISFVGLTAEIYNEIKTSLKRKKGGKK